MNESMEKYYGKTLKVCWALGFDVGNLGGKHLKKVLRINFLIVFLTLFQQFFFLVDADNDFVERLTIAPCLINAVLATIKFVNSVYYCDKIKQVMTTINKLYEGMDSKEQESLTITFAPLRKISIAFGVVYIALGSLFNFAPLLNMLHIYLTSGQLVLLHPFFAWFPIDWNEYYFSTYLYEFYFVQLAACISVIFDVLYTMILGLIISHFHLLGEFFKKLVEEMNDTKNVSVEHERRFKHLINVQLTLHRQCDELNRIYGPTFLLHVLVVSVTICFTGFVVSTQTDVFIIANNFTFMSTVLIHTFVLCWFGEKIEAEVMSLN